MTRPPQAIRERPPLEATDALVRPDGREPGQMRAFKIERGVLRNPEGSALVTMGHTRVLCSATVEERVPAWLRGQARGWVTAEYGMLPRSTTERTARSAQTGGRAQEIQRLIGRSLRTVTDLTRFGERLILIDCDVIDADGGTRTAAINGALVALHDAFVTLSNRGQLTGPPLKDAVAAVSVGMVHGVPRLDLAYAEDSAAEVDMNVVMTGALRYVEVQGTGESAAFSEAELKAMLKLARGGIRRILGHQRRLLGDSGLLPTPAS
ncbi:MAG: ribonuclease PH [Candidatus Eisenbacteria bacterium]|uniref:Ribonuclease PH n=1 Tax=Eiseniibacteriota bacterium TaxID=2212470 RepID=A0A538U0P3_UNCEI|nr:MAG: ribonuclease PH [Candidatus Eisenbacteria bacterium]